MQNQQQSVQVSQDQSAQHETQSAVASQSRGTNPVNPIQTEASQSGETNQIQVGKVQRKVICLLYATNLFIICY
jgi:hypothetical protein